MATYRALRDGSIGAGKMVKRVRTGEEFELPKGLKPGKWMEKVGGESKPATKSKAELDTEAAVKAKAGDPDDAEAAKK